MQDLKSQRFRKILKRFFSIVILHKKRRFYRVLPIGEYCVDRIKKAEFLKWGVGSTCYDNVYIFGDVRVGKNTFVGPFCLLDGSGGLKIGDNCSISAGVHIYTHDSVEWAVSMGADSYQYGRVEIGDGCYIGPNAVIARGVKIGVGSIVGACSFVNSDIPPHSKAYGIPARFNPLNRAEEMSYAKASNAVRGGVGHNLAFIGVSYEAA